MKLSNALVTLALLGIGITVGLTACNKTAEPSVPIAPQQLIKASDLPPTSQRFGVEFAGTFQDDTAYENKRRIYILTDKKTNRQYLGVSGVGISEIGATSDGEGNQTKHEK